MSEATISVVQAPPAWKLPYRGKVATACLIVAESAIFTIFVVAYLYYAGRSLKAQMRQADRIAARYAVILGENEVTQGIASVKDLREGGEQESVILDALIERLAR